MCDPCKISWIKSTPIDLSKVALSDPFHTYATNYILIVREKESSSKKLFPFEGTGTPIFFCKENLYAELLPVTWIWTAVTESST